jgi:hypothetical protein
MYGIGRHLYSDNKPQRRASAPTRPAAPRNAPTPRPVAVPSPDEPPDLDEAEWDALIGDAKTVAEARQRVDAIAAQLGGLTSREFFELVDDKGIDRKAVTAKARQLYGADKWRVTDLTAEERANLWTELAA